MSRCSELSPLKPVLNKQLSGKHFSHSSLQFMLPNGRTLLLVKSPFINSIMETILMCITPCIFFSRYLYVSIPDIYLRYSYLQERNLNVIWIQYQGETLEWQVSNVKSTHQCYDTYSTSITPPW